MVVLWACLMPFQHPVKFCPEVIGTNHSLCTLVKARVKLPKARDASFLLIGVVCKYIKLCVL